ncbi:MAG: hypothetical protein KJO98_05170, partial [Rhodothermia bacterium]|nr:hypothetical protein [Rhodothermia bacterium]
MNSRNARLMLSTLRHLRPWQILGRVFARAKPFTAAHAVPEGLTGELDPRQPFSFHDPWNTADNIRSGRFCFLDREIELGNPVNWRPQEAPLLWQFNLHYFNYLHLLESAEQVLLCRSWIEANEPGQQPGWHPYPTSLRIANWCKCGISEPQVLRSLYVQASFLVRNLETYVYGNHLLENARALVMAGQFLSGHGEAPKWLKKGYDIYRSELQEQILPDGLHFEKSPMYHALMLDNLLDVISITPDSEPDGTLLRDFASRMSAALPVLVHPDGQLALLNDSTTEIAPPPKAILERARRLGIEPEHRKDLPSSGYYVLR